jgi:membrane-bound lytic murein transglycosylase D
MFHDTWNLDVIYAVESVPKMGSRGRLKTIQAKKALIRAALTRFARGAKPATKYERRLYASIPEKHRVRSFFAEAKDRVRCQRGVDLGPSLARSRKYLPMIRSELRKSNIPTDLAYLPHLESGFDVRAHSRAGAKGIWQFTRGGAKFAGLKVTNGKKGRKSIDERLDPVRSTKAAIGHLADIQSRTGSWSLTITAYNYGHNGVARAIKKFGPDYLKIRTHHKTRIFGFAARNYFPSFVAVRNVAQRYERESKSGSANHLTLASTAKKSGAL